jgi:hypothetical protein
MVLVQPRRTRRRSSAALVLLATAGLAGCGADEDADVAGVVTRFYAAVATTDGEAACAALAPDSRSEVVGTDPDGRACPQALLAPEGPGSVLVSRAADADVLEVHRAGGQAQVVTETDTLFLAVDGTSWVVTAAGCDPRGERPYDCVVEP